MFYMLEKALNTWEETHKGSDLRWEKRLAFALPGYVDGMIFDMWNIKENINTRYLLNDIAWKVASRMVDEDFTNNKGLLHLITDRYLYNFTTEDESFNVILKRATACAMGDLLFNRAVVNYFTKQHLICYYKKNIDADLSNFPHNEIDKIMEVCSWKSIKEVCDKIIKEYFKYKKVTFELKLPTNTNVNDIISYIHDKFDGNVTIK